MYNRSCVEKGELVFKKILKKEIESRRFKEYSKKLNLANRSYFAGYCWVNDQILNNYKNHWNAIKDLIAPTLASFNNLGKKYPLSTRLQKTLRRNLIYDTMFVQKNCTTNRNIIVKGISETLNNFGNYLLEIDDVFALSVIEIAYRLEQVDLLKKALDKLSDKKYEISPFGLEKIRVMEEKELIFYKLLTKSEYECCYCDKFLELLLLCFDKSQVIQLLSTDLDTCGDLPLEKRDFLLENGFVPFL